MLDRHFLHPYLSHDQSQIAFYLSSLAIDKILSTIHGIDPIVSPTCQYNGQKKTVHLLAQCLEKH